MAEGVFTIPESGEEPKRRIGRPPGSKNKTSAPRGRKAAPTADAIGESLTNLYGLLGITLAAIPGYAPDGVLIAEHSEQLAQSWVELAKTDPRVLKVLRRIVVGNAYGTVLFAHLAVAVPIAARHNMLPKAAAAAFHRTHAEEAEEEKEPAKVFPIVADKSTDDESAS